MNNAIPKGKPLFDILREKKRDAKPRVRFHQDGSRFQYRLVNTNLTTT